MILAANSERSRSRRGESRFCTIHWRVPTIFGVQKPPSYVSAEWNSLGYRKGSNLEGRLHLISGVGFEHLVDSWGSKPSYDNPCGKHVRRSRESDAMKVQCIYQSLQLSNMQQRRATDHKSVSVILHGTFYTYNRSKHCKVGPA